MPDLKSIEKRFNAGYVVCDLTGCWIWNKTVRSGGYGQIRAGCLGEYYAHRVSYVLFVGTIPDGMQVLHDCPHGDNPACVNPAHLWVGTHNSNMNDKISKGRSLVGEKNPSSKLTEKQVLKALICNRGKGRLRALATKFGVLPSTLTAIRRGKSWKYLQQNQEKTCAAN